MHQALTDASSASKLCDKCSIVRIVSPHTGHKLDQARCVANAQDIVQAVSFGHFTYLSRLSARSSRQHSNGSRGEAYRPEDSG